MHMLCGCMTVLLQQPPLTSRRAGDIPVHSLIFPPPLLERRLLKGPEPVAGAAEPPPAQPPPPALGEDHEATPGGTCRLGGVDGARGGSPLPGPAPMPQGACTELLVDTEEGRAPGCIRAWAEAAVCGCSLVGGTKRTSPGNSRSNVLSRCRKDRPNASSPTLLLRDWLLAISWEQSMGGRTSCREWSEC